MQGEIQHFCGSEMLIFHCTGGRVEEEAKSRECFLLRNTHQMLRLASSDAGPAFDIVLAVLCMFPWVVGASDAQASVRPTHVAFLRLSRLYVSDEACLMAPCWMHLTCLQEV